jgi:hypothetical protein
MNCSLVSIVRTKKMLYISTTNGECIYSISIVSKKGSIDFDTFLFCRYGSWTAEGKNEILGLCSTQDLSFVTRQVFTKGLCYVYLNVYVFIIRSDRMLMVSNALQNILAMSHHCILQTNLNLLVVTFIIHLKFISLMKYSVKLCFMKSG